MFKSPPGWPRQGTIKVENLSLRYREGLDLVLKDINFEVKAGEKVCSEQWIFAYFTLAFSLDEEKKKRDLSKLYGLLGVSGAMYEFKTQTGNAEILRNRESWTLNQ